MKYEIEISQTAEADINKLSKSGEKGVLKKLYLILDELEQHPESGTGKPERLKHYNEPTWSRRLSSKHRLVYEIQEEKVLVVLLSAWGHYKDK